MKNKIFKLEDYGAKSAFESIDQLKKYFVEKYYPILSNFDSMNDLDHQSKLLKQYSKIFSVIGDLQKNIDKENFEAAIYEYLNSQKMKLPVCFNKIFEKINLKKGQLENALLFKLVNENDYKKYVE